MRFDAGVREQLEKRIQTTQRTAASADSDLREDITRFKTQKLRLLVSLEKVSSED